MIVVSKYDSQKVAICSSCSSSSSSSILLLVVVLLLSCFGY